MIKKSEVRKVHPAVWQHPVIFGKVHNELCRFKCKLSNTGATWSSSDPSIVSVDSNREQWDLSGCKTILYTGRSRKNATVSESFDGRKNKR